jgi:DNA-binding response OmpR family regulator
MTIPIGPTELEPSPQPGVPVLLVDDNQDAATVLAEMLEQLGYKVRVAYDGPQALAALETFTPALALLDIGLPVMDGYELARRLRAHASGARTRLIALTGYGHESDRARSAQAHFDAHLVKPVDVSELASRMRALLDRAQWAPSTRA